MPQYRAQLSTLQAMSSTSGALASALTGAGGNVSALLSQFDRAALGTQTPAVQRAQIAAIRACDSAASQIDGLGRQVERERTRLADTLK
ncbi:MAG: hypothetical protein ACYC91_00535 [Solirubrobacteraceae bacterium]